MHLEQLRPLLERNGPFVSVYADVSRTSEAGRQQVDARSTSVRHELEHLGVSSDLREELVARLAEVTHLHGDVRRSLVAADEEIVFDDTLMGGSRWPEGVELGPLPSVSGWATQLDGQFPFLLVVADREGADIDVHVALSRPSADHKEVHGSTLHIRKVPEGDWAQKEFQQRSENVWAANARLVAERVRTAHAHYRPRLVVLAGDVRARTDLTKALDGLPVPVEQVESGGRGAGASEQALWDDVRRILARYEADAERDIAERLERGTATGSGVARGIEDVLDALVGGEVDTVVADLDAAHQMSVRPADHPGLALPPSALEADELPADQVLLAAGAATGAQLSVLPRELSHGAGVAALLRWDE
jgi:hypothetical protein